MTVLGENIFAKQKPKFQPNIEGVYWTGLVSRINQPISSNYTPPCFRFCTNKGGIIGPEHQNFTAAFGGRNQPLRSLFIPFYCCFLLARRSHSVVSAVSSVGYGRNNCDHQLRSLRVTWGVRTKFNCDHLFQLRSKRGYRRNSTAIIYSNCDRLL